MQKELQEEVVHCLNCGEDVPRTLYCLNCGHPLYKEEGAEGREGVAAEAEIRSPPAEPAVVVEAAAEREEPSPPEVEPIPSSEPATLPVEAAPVVVPEQIPEASQTQVEEEQIRAQADIREATAEKVESDAAADVQPPEEFSVGGVLAGSNVSTLELTTEPAQEAPPAPSISIVEEVAREAAEERPTEAPAPEPPEPSEEPPTMYEAEGPAAEVRGNLARNLAIMVKLVDLLREGGISEPTFHRLFEGYAAVADRWMSRRIEMLERSRSDAEAAERALSAARTSLEELEVRRTIGEASEEEYTVKAPAYEWDVRTLAEGLQRSRAEAAYLDSIDGAMPAEEAEALRRMAENGFDELNRLVESGGASAETVSRIRRAFAEALSSMET